MKSIKRILAIVMIMAMMFSLVVINASASRISISDLNGFLQEGTLEAGSATYESSTNTLTLVGAKITTSSGSGISFNKTGDINIVVKGNCEINASDFGIYSSDGNKFTITGEDGASLTINSDEIGIYINGAENLTIENVALTITSSCSDSISTDGNLTIKNSNVTCEAFADAITASKDIKIDENSKMDVTSKRGSGIYAPSGNIEIDESTLDIDAGYIGIAAYNAAYNLTINNSKVDIEAENSGINFYGNIIFSGKDLIDVETKGSVSAVRSDKNIEFNLTAGAKVHAKSANGLAFSAQTGHVVLTSGVITLPENGTITSEGDSIAESTDKQAGVKEATVELKEYEIETPVAELTWERGCCDVLTVTSEAEYNLFTKILVDDAEVAEQDSSKDYKNYYVMKGSTKVLLSAGYLETLAVGDHTIEIVSNDGSAKGTFTIVEAAKKEEPTTKKEETKVVEEEKVADTADNSAIGAFVALGAFAAAGYVSLKKKEN